jgi:uncharacterized coiled-coil protein SlyX
MEVELAALQQMIALEEREISALNRQIAGLTVQIGDQNAEIRRLSDRTVVLFKEMKKLEEDQARKNGVPALLDLAAEVENKTIQVRTRLGELLKAPQIPPARELETNKSLNQFALIASRIACFLLFLLS